MELLQSKGKAFANAVEDVKEHLAPDEKVYASIQLGLSTVLLTKYRIAVLTLAGIDIKASYALADIDSFRIEAGKISRILYITPRGQKEVKLGGIYPDVESKFIELLTSLMDGAEALPEVRSNSVAMSAQRYASIPTNRTKAGLPNHLVKSIINNSKQNEDPEMIITGSIDSTDGSLIVYRDRCVISKSGIIGGLMAGTLGGSRDATFYFKDITGIEYNSGMMSGVLEILTASYDGSANKDYWRGITNPNRNNSKNDPRALSNTLPLMKADYMAAKPLIDKLRTMIQEAKETKVIIQAASSIPANSTADEIQKLAELMEKGLLSQEEFQAAKNKLLGLA